MILNRLDEARLIFEKCLKMDTGYQQRTYIQLADVYERKGQMEKPLNTTSLLPERIRIIHTHGEKPDYYPCS